MAVTRLAKYSDVSSVSDRVDQVIRTSFDTLDLFLAESISDLQDTHGSSGTLYVTVKSPQVTYSVDLAQAAAFEFTTQGGVEVTIESTSGEIISARQLGVVADGTTDDTVAVQRCMDYGTGSPGCVIQFPQGFALITSPIDVTYAGVAAGTSSPYYGFTIKGTGQYNSGFLVRTSGAIGFDFSGKPRMTFRDIGFVNYTDDSGQPSAFVLFARNLTNGIAGNHFFENILFRGYATDTLFQCASSEVNAFVKVSWEPYANDCSCLELTEQIDTTVVSPFIDHTGHTFSGGNTRHTFLSCEFNSSVPTSGSHAISISALDNTGMTDCYFKARGDATIRVTANSSNFKITNCRDESEGGHFLVIEDGATLTAFDLDGRSSRSILGEDNSTLDDCRISPSFMASSTSFSLDVYDLLGCDVSGMTNDIRVRNSALRSRFHDRKQASQISVPSGDTTAPDYYWLGYSGGSSDYQRKVENTGAKYKRHEMGRVHIATPIVPNIHNSAASGTITPDLDEGSSLSIIIAGDLTIADPTNIDLGPDDPNGQELTFVFSQDATGGHTVSFGSSYDLQGDSVSTSAFARKALRFKRASTSGGIKWVKI